MKEIYKDLEKKKKLETFFNMHSFVYTLFLLYFKETETVFRIYIFGILCDQTGAKLQEADPYAK